jgi:hypothetical protein
MLLIIALLITFFAGLILSLCGMNPLLSWLLSFFVIPVFVLLSEFVLPNMGGGA